MTWQSCSGEGGKSGSGLEAEEAESDKSSRDEGGMSSGLSGEVLTLRNRRLLYYAVNSALGSVQWA